ncbi:uncharacterized protein RJT21DRAFT_126728 [Scheffersomyces amazonensis]|uniref:uncharacterized protein n=1 Tax=Scheffersomyces amazonensis TaxID=1078765 RepID=UPI00315CF835
MASSMMTQGTGGSKWSRQLLRGMSTEQSILFLLRLFISLIASILLLTTIVSPFSNQSSYVMKISCGHIDVQAGLSASLKHSLEYTNNPSSDSDYSGIPFDSSLTSSAIQLISQYSADAIEDAPQYITITLWNWCSTNYNISSTNEKSRYNEVSVCTKANQRTLVEYREILVEVGLSPILSYAFQTSNYLDQSYTNASNRRHARYTFFVPGLATATGLQIIVLILVILLYLKDRTLRSKTSILVSNLVAIISLISFICLSLAVGLITSVIASIKAKFNTSLNSFGISVHSGRLWFSTLFVGLFINLISTLVWVIPLWCANPSPEKTGIRISSRQTYQNIRVNSSTSLQEGNNDIDDEIDTPPRINHKDSEQELKKLGAMVNHSGRYRVESLHSTDLESGQNVEYAETVYSGYDANNPFYSIPLIRGDFPSTVGSSSNSRYNTSNNSNNNNNNNHNNNNNNNHNNNLIPSLDVELEEIQIDTDAGSSQPRRRPAQTPFSPSSYLNRAITESSDPSPAQPFDSSKIMRN